MLVGGGGILRRAALVLVGVVLSLSVIVRIRADPPRPIRAVVVVAQATALVRSLATKLAVRRCVICIVYLAVPQTLHMSLSTRSAAFATAGVYHATAYVCLLSWFARSLRPATSLRPNREPVVTGFARRIRRTMPKEVVDYTRHVTIAWCIFFAAQLGMSAGLLVSAPMWAWSSFVTLWNLPLVVAMILAEFACRSVLLRRDLRTGPIATLTGMWHINGLPGSVP